MNYDFMPIGNHSSFIFLIFNALLTCVCMKMSFNTTKITYFSFLFLFTVKAVKKKKCSTS